MRLTLVDGWLQEAERIPSPNCDPRPAGEDISLIVIHGISLPEGEFGTPYIDALFTNRIRGDEAAGFQPLAGLRVSAHLLIRRGGELVQYVSLEERAWHAGRSSFEGRARCNDFSIGIELEGADQIPYGDLQYRMLAQVVDGVMAHYPQITPQRIVGHSDIAPGRKTDPGPAFEWQRFREELEQ
jgi:AmpD protein